MQCSISLAPAYSRSCLINFRNLVIQLALFVYLNSFYKINALIIIRQRNRISDQTLSGDTDKKRININLGYFSALFFGLAKFGPVKLPNGDNSIQKKELQNCDPTKNGFRNFHNKSQINRQGERSLKNTFTNTVISNSNNLRCHLHGLVTKLYFCL